MKKIFILLASAVLTISCSTQQIQQTVGAILGGGSGSVTESEAAGGLKEALTQGINIGMGLLSKQDGFYGNSLVKIPWPDQAEKIKNAMIKLGMQDKVDNVTKSLNRAAEKASGVAIDVFVNSIKQMTIQDAMTILLGGDGTATAYLKKTSTPLLTEKFRPIIDNSLNQVNATKLWSEALTIYNQIPFVQSVNTDLTGFVTEKALDGVFKMVEKEENKIRENPLARVTSLMKKVFGFADAQKNN
ncbi:MAG: DUF4197 domain-containing protein [Chitinophagales bacterium]|nr:DUF4197 domain-containing protein [Chitinophagales bacterium]